MAARARSHVIQPSLCAAHSWPRDRLRSTNPARCLSAMLAPIHHAWRLGYCNSPCEGSRSAPRKEQTGEGHGVYASFTPRKALAYSVGLHKSNYRILATARKLCWLSLKLLTSTNSVPALCYCLLLYRAALAPTCCLCPDAQMPIWSGPLHWHSQKLRRWPHYLVCSRLDSRE